MEGKRIPRPHNIQMQVCCQRGQSFLTFRPAPGPFLQNSSKQGTQWAQLSPDLGVRNRSQKAAAFKTKITGASMPTRPLHGSHHRGGRKTASAHA